MTTIFVLTMLGLALLLDFKTDKGQFRKAKAVHAICVLALGATYADIFRFLPRLVMNFSSSKAQFSVPLGILPGWLHFSLSLLNWSLMFLVVLLLFRMARRNDKARTSFLFILPFFSITQTLDFFRAWKAEDAGLGFSDTVVMLIALVAMGLAAGVFWLIYSSSFMKSLFLGQKTGNPSNTNEILDAGL